MKTVDAPITDLSQLDPEGRYSYSEYYQWRFEERVELIRGRVFRMPATNTLHQRVSGMLTMVLGNYFYKQSCQVFMAPFDVRLPQEDQSEIYTVVQPDLSVFCDPKRLDEKGGIGAPDLVIEIIIPGNSHREMREKYEVYEEAGVKEYWLVNPWERIVLVYVLNEKGIFIGLQPLTDEQTLETGLFPGLKIPLGELFEAPKQV